MSLNMHLGETDAQSNSMNRVYVEIIQAMEATMASIVSFITTSSLQGETYHTAKNFMIQTYYPLAQGIIYLSEELIRQNSKYPGNFRAQVSTTHVMEHEVLNQLRELDLLIASLESVNEQTPIFSMSIYLYRTMRQMLEEKLSHLYRFNADSANNYDVAFELSRSILTGLNELLGSKGFNHTTGTFHTEGMNLDWIATIEEIYYTKKATEKYGHYLEEHPEDLQKIMTMMKYEERSPDYVKTTNEFLSPLEQTDIIGIKYIMYTTEEPYRSLTMQYLDRLELIPVSINSNDGVGPGPSFFRPSENAIHYVYERDRTNARGSYFTFFHEVAHAIDYNYGYDVDGGFIRDVKEFFGTYEYYSDDAEIDGHTLNDHMYHDFEDNVQQILTNDLTHPNYDELNQHEKTIVINNISENLLNQDRDFENLTATEQQLQMSIEDHFSEQLAGPDHSIASDVYGGITNFAIQGSYGHNENYWFDHDERIREPNREGFAEYFARLVTQDRQEIDRGIESVNQFLPRSRKHMDAMIESMNGK